MKITFLGTAAATSYPLVFCSCNYCNEARRKGGRDLRKRSSLLINQDLLIDLGPDIISSSFMHGVSIADIRYCLQTHSHSDHFDASHLGTRAPEYAIENMLPLDLYASKATLDRISEMLRHDGSMNGIFDDDGQKRMKLRIHTIKALQSFNAGRYHISAFSANHDALANSLLYSITEDDFTVFYGTDTDDIPETTWQGFHDKKLQFDIVILDHTYGPNVKGDGHLNSDQFIRHIQRMRDEDLLKEKARIFATHISHEGNPLHDDLAKYAKRHGYEIAFDGLIIRDRKLSR